MSANDLSDLPATIVDFPAFFAARRGRMKERLSRLLASADTDSVDGVVVQPQD
jgi:hypothetical protein